MARKNGRSPRRVDPPQQRSAPARGPLFFAVVLTGAIVAAVVAVVLLRNGDGNGAALGELLDAADPGPVHVHGLGINPADGALFVATHTGTYRVAPGDERATRIGDSRQDTMGFTVAGPNHFLGSGHPDVREASEEGLPPLLGLIESRDAGRTWRPVSLLGEADFHVLRFAGRRVYGYDASNDRLLVSDNAGSSWRQVGRPAPLLDLAVDPRDPHRLIASAETGLYASENGGRSWTRLSDRVGLLAWPQRKRLYLLDGTGAVLVSAAGGARWQRLGKVGGEPAALLARSARELYVALHDGTIKRSTTAGRTWAVRWRP